MPIKLMNVLRYLLNFIMYDFGRRFVSNAKNFTRLLSSETETLSKIFLILKRTENRDFSLSTRSYSQLVLGKKVRTRNVQRNFWVVLHLFLINSNI